MCEVAEKFEFMMMRAVKVCPKAGVGRSLGLKNPCFRTNLQQNRRGKGKS